jgi:hypothetical protein
MLRYARIDAISKRLAPRISVVNTGDYGVLGITGTEIGTDLIYLAGEGVEEMVDMYLNMIYVLPLINSHPFLISIVEKLICSDIYLTYFPTQGESSDNTDNYAGILRTQALSDFQTLFDGTGIYVPGAMNQSQGIQNDENKAQQAVKSVFLAGEVIKRYIGIDYDNDGIPDTDLYLNNRIESSGVYVSENFNRLSDDSRIVSGVRVKPRYSSNNNNDISQIIDFW